MGLRWIGLKLGVPIRLRLPFGSWWIARNDAAGRAIVRNRFENLEHQFVERLLKPGMVVLDIGAHHGYYTLLASRKVGKSGLVIAFEPSPRERGRLLEHVRLNACTNVRVEAFALGKSEGDADLLVVQGKETGCNSFRPPQSQHHGQLRREVTKATKVQLTSLDSYLQKHDIPRVDFVKMDVEGGELDVLKGATDLLARPIRPTFLCELQDLHTSAWGYRAREIADFLIERGYHWFISAAAGSMQPVPRDQVEFDGNFVAIPQERIDEVFASM